MLYRNTSNEFHTEKRKKKLCEGLNKLEVHIVLNSHFLCCVMSIILLIILLNMLPRRGRLSVMSSHLLRSSSRFLSSFFFFFLTIFSFLQILFNKLFLLIIPFLHFHPLHPSISLPHSPFCHLSPKVTSSPIFVL